MIDLVAMLRAKLLPESPAVGVLRIGDAVAARNIHAAIYDGIRFALRI